MDTILVSISLKTFLKFFKESIFLKCDEIVQVVHLRRNEYNSQFVFLVEMIIMVIKETLLRISQNDYYDQL